MASEQRDHGKLFDPGFVNAEEYKLKPESDFDPDNLTESQIAELRRRAALDYREYGSKDEYMAYVEDVAMRKHLSWY